LHRAVRTPGPRLNGERSALSPEDAERSSRHSTKLIGRFREIKAIVKERDEQMAPSKARALIGRPHSDPRRTAFGIDTALVALAFASGSLDVSSLLRLGGVFASIMTSNLIFVSLAVVKGDATLGQHCATALLSYVAGVGAGSRLTPPSGRESRLGTRRLSTLLVAEAFLLAFFAAWWIAAGARPGGWQQLTLLGAVTFAMGLQGAAARSLGDPKAGTTYVTGTLTGMVATAVTGRRPDDGAVFAIIGILVGAAAGVGLLESFPDLTPFPAVAGVAFAAGLSWIEHHHTPDPTTSSPVVAQPAVGP
jgi:uncharacterized membrane protein YoaK (UPF0700 family)